MVYDSYKSSENRDNLSCNVRKRTFVHARRMYDQISRHIRTVSSEYSLGTVWTAKDTKSLYVYNEGSDQIAQAVLSLFWAYMSEGTFSHVTTYFSKISL